MDLYEKNGNILYILNVLRKYSNEENMLSITEIQRKIREIYNIEVDPRTIRRNINLLKEKFEYDISTRNENGKGYYILNNPETDFEPGEIRAIIDNFSYASYIVPSMAKSIIEKCKNMQNIYENEKLKDYRIYANNNKTDNMEVIKNIEDISNAISKKSKIKFEYWKYSIEEKLEKIIVSNPVVAPYAIIYNKQEFYLIGIKDGVNEFYHYRLDRIKNIILLNKKIDINKTQRQIQDFAESTVEMFGGKKEEIEVDCAMYLLDSVFDVFGKNITIIRKDEDSFKMILDANTFGFQMWAMRNIDAVEVIKPVRLRNEMKEIVKEAFEKYNK